MEIAHNIDLNIFARLRDDRAYRRKFFLAESSALIAEQLIALRKRRGLNQKQVAEATGTHQPAISRAEQADYQNWSFSALRKIADALDARIRVFIEPSEDVINEYENRSDADELNCVNTEAPSTSSILLPWTQNSAIIPDTSSVWRIYCTNYDHQLLNSIYSFQSPHTQEVLTVPAPIRQDLQSNQVPIPMSAQRGHLVTGNA